MVQSVSNVVAWFAWPVMTRPTFTIVTVHHTNVTGRAQGRLKMALIKHLLKHPILRTKRVVLWVLQPRMTGVAQWVSQMRGLPWLCKHLFRLC